MSERSACLSPSTVHRRLMKEPPSERWNGSEDLAVWQRRVRRKVRQALGMPDAAATPLKARSLWTREVAEGTIEKIVFQAEPGADVPAYVCLPKDARGKLTWAVCLQGHSSGMHNSIAVDRDDNSKPIAVEGDRDFGLGCMRRGVAALCIEQRSFGERRELEQEKRSNRMCQEAVMHALALGRTLLGERVFDVDRALDYLFTRKDVDRKRVGVMGNSGGGTVSLFSAALLPRVRWAMPSSYFCTFADSIMSLHHCECNYVPGLHRLVEMSDVLGLAAPKPVTVVNGVQDDIFPITAARKSFRDLKRIYKAAGAAERCRMVEGPGGHRFYADLAWPVMLKLIAGL